MAENRTEAWLRGRELETQDSIGQKTGELFRKDETI